MDNIIRNPENYKRFVSCSAAIEILVCLILLILLVKEAYNFYMKNYVLYMIADRTCSKYEDATSTMFDNQLPKKQQPNSPKQISTTMKTSKTALAIKPPNPIAPALNPNPIPSAPKPQPSFAYKQKPRLQMDDLQKQSTRYRISLYIQRIMLKLPIFAIMVINIAMLTSYQFLTCMAYIGIIVLAVNQFVAQRWNTLGVILDVVVAGITVAGFINGFVTVRIDVRIN